MTRQQILRLLALTLFASGLTVVSGAIVQSSGTPTQAQSLGSAFVVAQRQIRPQEVAIQFYERLPDFPRENQYVSAATGEVDADNTLVMRLIRYHIYVRGRPTQYRLDWKLTLADYLGVNKPMQAETYPGYETLRTNPLDGDRDVIRQFSRTERNALIHTLVSSFNPQYARLQSASSQTPSTEKTPTGFGTSSPPSQAGDAEMLLSP